MNMVDVCTTDHNNILIEWLKGEGDPKTPTDPDLTTNVLVMNVSSMSDPTIVST